MEITRTRRAGQTASRRRSYYFVTTLIAEHRIWGCVAADAALPAYRPIRSAQLVLHPVTTSAPPHILRRTRSGRHLPDLSDPAIRMRGAVSTTTRWAAANSWSKKPAGGSRLNDRLSLAAEALRGFVVMLDFFGQLLDPFRVDFLGAINQFFAGLLIALDHLVQTLFSDVVSTLAFVLHVPFSTRSRFLWLNRRAAERFRPQREQSSRQRQSSQCQPSWLRLIFRP